MSSLEEKIVLRYFRKIKYPWNTSKGFFGKIFEIFFISIAIAGSFFGFYKGIFGENQLQYWIIVLIFLSPFIAIIIYTAVFFISRSWINIIISKKTNIVLAYNTEAIEDFEKKYISFVKALENEIRENGLENKIKIIKKPTDIKISGPYAAEAKTKLGLRGSVLLIWGHVTQNNKKTAFKTYFSYEFGYPPFLSKEFAKKMFNKKIEGVINSGLFKLSNKNIPYINADIFSENILETSLFILSSIVDSLGDVSKAVIFSEKFYELYQKVGYIRQVEMIKAWDIVEEIMIRNKINLAKDAWDVGKFGEVKKTLDEILKLKKYYYPANIFVALYYEKVEKNRPLAKEFTNIAKVSYTNRDETHKYNQAYFDLDEGNYESAIKIYDSISYPDSIIINEVREFLYKEYCEKKELAFLFGEAYLANKFQDKKAGKFLKEFIKKTNGNTEKYKILRKKAEEEIKKRN